LILYSYSYSYSYLLNLIRGPWRTFLHLIIPACVARSRAALEGTAPVATHAAAILWVLRNPLACGTALPSTPALVIATTSGHLGGASRFTALRGEELADDIVTYLFPPRGVEYGTTCELIEGYICHVSGLVESVTSPILTGHYSPAFSALGFFLVEVRFGWTLVTEPNSAIAPEFLRILAYDLGEIPRIWGSTLPLACNPATLRGDHEGVQSCEIRYSIIVVYIDCRGAVVDIDPEKLSPRCERLICRESRQRGVICVREENMIRSTKV
jgi:hypothetical protein